MSDTTTPSAAEVIIHAWFADRIRMDGACARWTGSHNPKGYGNAHHADHPGVRGAHRLAWLLTHGEIPAGLEVHHDCHVRDCVNLHHLRIVTPSENKADQRHPAERPWQRVTHCVNGHEYTPENTIQTKTQRVCRTCRAETVRRNNWKRRGVPQAVIAVGRGL